MAKRGVVTDYAGNELHPGDLVAYSARQGNRVRMADAVVLEATAKQAQVEGVGAVLVPVLKVQPTGVESGFVKRKTAAAQWITTEHVRLVTPGFVDVTPENPEVVG
ncbi:hypothetical protein HOS59_gp36 [Streptomyces phage Rowa]|uniref:Uncharacterized protein n=1 Tax=Streptomyces phage Rowa TaxID=2059883 RepID=A0A2H5BLT8_9CAUD|nr:hypothetical protein HOS59_gp36 [Streptomyces phage Rowa]AUG87300.1 hypothetical protein SEA_ROWA_36 [Streptomyces phage Rowa]